MSKFVNPKNRHFLLPPGKKDLIDVLNSDSGQLLPELNPHAGHWELEHDETVMTRLSGVGAIVGILIRAGNETRHFCLRAALLQFQLHLDREVDSSLSCRVVFPDDQLWVSRMCEVFSLLKLRQNPKCGTETPVMFPELPAQNIWDVLPLPVDQEALTGLVIRIFEQSCHLTMEAMVEFVRCEFTHPD